MTTHDVTIHDFVIHDVPLYLFNPSTNHSTLGLPLVRQHENKLLDTSGTIVAEYMGSMKTAVLSVLVALALSPHASAVLRPRFPNRPVPPTDQHTILIVDDNSTLSPGSKPPR